jgi:pterin-4a-carbinolamine dehydratase
MSRVPPRKVAEKVRSAYNSLASAEQTLMHLASTIAREKPHYPVWSRDFTRIIATVEADIHSAMQYLKEVMLGNIVDALYYARAGLDSIYVFLRNLENLCGLIGKQKLLVHPNPCVHTATSKLKVVALDFEKTVRFLQKRETPYLRSYLDEVMLRDPLSVVEDATVFISTFYSKCSEIVGRKCAHFEDEVADRLNLSLMALANNMATSIHRIYELLIVKYGDLQLTVVEGIPVAFHPRADPELIEAIKTWAKASNKLFLKATYIPEDYKALAAVALEDYGWIRVGSVAGHATHIKHPKWAIEYFDVDMNVNKTLARLYKDAGFSTEPTHYGLKLTTPPGKLKQALAILALSTSMDIRIMGKDLEEAYDAEKARMEKLLKELGFA